MNLRVFWNVFIEESLVPKVLMDYTQAVKLTYSDTKHAYKNKPQGAVIIFGNEFYLHI